MDNDPIVLAHARALLTTTAEGAIAYLLAISEATRDIDADSITQSAARFNSRRVAATFTPRTRPEIARYFTGLDLVDPGLVPLPHWRALANPAQHIPAYAAVARKP